MFLKISFHIGRIRIQNDNSGSGQNIPDPTGSGSGSGWEEVFMLDPNWDSTVINQTTVGQVRYLLLLSAVQTKETYLPTSEMIFYSKNDV